MHMITGNAKGVCLKEEFLITSAIPLVGVKRNEHWQRTAWCTVVKMEVIEMKTRRTTFKEVPSLEDEDNILPETEVISRELTSQRIIIRQGLST